MIEPKLRKSGLRLKGKLVVPKQIEVYLRADPRLPPETIKALTEMIVVAYQASVDGKLKE